MFNFTPVVGIRDKFSPSVRRWGPKILTLRWGLGHNVPKSQTKQHNNSVVLNSSEIIPNKPFASQTNIPLIREKDDFFF